MKAKLLGWMTLVLLVTTACADGGSAVENDKAKQGLEGKVLQSMRASQYVVMEIEQRDETFWAATGFREVEPGDQVELVSPILMADFEVKSLDRTFSEIYFAQAIVVNGKRSQETGTEAEGNAVTEAQDPHAEMGNPHAGMGMHMTKNSGQGLGAADVEPLQSGVTLSELMGDAVGYSGKQVQVRVRVVKFLSNIMKRNWIHLKDSTTGETHVVATTEDQFRPGETVIVEATVTVDRDFGFGYQYDLLLEDARRITP